MENNYDDIINLPHYVSKTRKRMSNKDRAAQFAPFAALNGHEEAVIETARLTKEKLLLDENQIAILDQRLQIMNDHLKLKQVITITYFKPDDRKSGGSYVSMQGIVKRIDTYNNVVIFEDNTKIIIDDIYSIEGQLFDPYEF